MQNTKESDFFVGLFSYMIFMYVRFLTQREHFQSEIWQMHPETAEVGKTEQVRLEMIKNYLFYRCMKPMLLTYLSL